MRAVSRMVFLLCLVCAPLKAFAGGLSITEIMFDPAGSDDKREWIEVYNGSAEPLDLAGHFLLTDGPTSSRHALVAQSSSSIPSGVYAVIVQDVAKFKTDFPAYDGILFDSSWSGLTATVGKTVLVVDAQSVPLDSVTYDPSLGGANTGDSLQSGEAGIWFAGPPTPGAGFTAPTEQDAPPAQKEELPPGGIQAGTSVAVQAPLPSKPHLEISMPARGIAGIPLRIVAKAYDREGTMRIYGSTYVALGDGSAHVGGAPESFVYTYEHAGVYALTFEYRGNPYSLDPDMTARATVEIVEPSVTVSSVLADGTIELLNEGERDVDVSGWMLAPRGDRFASTTFKFPSGTILLAKKKVLLAQKISGFTISDVHLAQLLLPSGESVSAVPVMAEKDIPASVVVEPAVETVEEYVEQPHIEAPVSISAVSQANALRAVQDEKKSVMPFFVGLVALVVSASIGLWKLGVFRRAVSEPVAPEPDEEAEEKEVRILE